MSNIEKECGLFPDIAEHCLELLHDRLNGAFGEEDYDYVAAVIDILCILNALQMNFIFENVKFENLNMDEGVILTMIQEMMHKTNLNFLEIRKIKNSAIEETLH